MKYRKIIATGPGGPSVLQCVEEEIPAPGPRDVLIRVLAAGVSYADILIREGVYPGIRNFPLTPGYDVVGQVEETGSDVTSVRRGDRVAALTVTGGYAGYLLLHQSELTKVPDGLDPAESVSLVLNYVTAYQMLHRAVRLRKGDTILVHGGSGGVGSALLQLGKLMELRILATASAGKHELVKSLGAIPVDYRSQDMEDRIRSLAPEGVSAAFDGTGKWVFPSYKILKSKGKLVLFGLSSMLEGGRRSLSKKIRAYLRLSVFFVNLLPVRKKVIFYQITGYRRKHPEWFREDLSTLFSLLRRKKIHPIIASLHPLQNAASCHELLMKGAVRGKMVLLPQASG